MLYFTWLSVGLKMMSVLGGNDAVSSMEHRHGAGAGCWRVHILMSRVFLDAQALGDLALVTSMIKPLF